MRASWAQLARPAANRSGARPMFSAAALSSLKAGLALAVISVAPAWAADGQADPFAPPVVKPNARPVTAIAYQPAPAAPAAPAPAKPAAAKPAANKYQVLPITPPPPKAENGLNAAMKNDATTPEIDALLDFKLAQMSLPNELPNYAALRQELKFRWFMRSLSGKFHDHITAKTFETCKQLAGKGFHPYTRVNAVLMIGELNKVEPQSKNGGIPPETFHDALPALLDFVESPDSVEGVVVAALTGIDRHARFAADGKTDEKVVERTRATLTKLASNADANPYIRRQAIRALGHLGLIGSKENPTQSLDLFVSVLQDANADMILRAEAARAIGVLDLRKANIANPVPIAVALASLAAEAGTMTGGEGKTWAGPRFDELRRVISYVEIGFNGRDPDRQKTEMDGYLVDGEGLLDGAAKAKPEQKAVVENLAQNVAAFATILFPANNKQPADADIASALDLLGQVVAGQAGAAPAAPATAAR